MSIPPPSKEAAYEVITKCFMHTFHFVSQNTERCLLKDSDSIKSTTVTALRETFLKKNPLFCEYVTVMNT